MHIKPNIVQDVFTTSYNAWPLASDQHWETVHTVSASFTQHKLPTLWSPLSSSADRAQAFAANKGKCLNCHGTDHDMRHCPQPFTNASGMLNNVSALCLTEKTSGKCGKPACGLTAPSNPTPPRLSSKRTRNRARFSPTRPKTLVITYTAGDTKRLTTHNKTRQL